MAKTTPRQRKTIGRVMHECEHCEPENGSGGRAGAVAPLRGQDTRFSAALLSSAPNIRTMVDSHTQVRKPTMAPSDP